jgi:ABC-type sulfate transport system permease component
VSFVLLLHLLVFIFIPLSMSITYIGPSRSFYSLLAVIVSKALSEEYVNVSITAFNVLMALVHGINLCYFSRRKTAGMFSPPSKGG